MKKISKPAKQRVRLNDRSYDIVIGQGLLGEGFGKLVAKQAGRVCLVSDTKVFGLYGGPLVVSLAKAGVKWTKITLARGERHKNMAAVMKIHDHMLKRKFDRHTAVIALGGGVVGDIAGFAAATYLRGVKVIQVPTTLLSQVDSSVGGKTGVNHPMGKNLIGAFHQPSLVVVDVDTLGSLPRAEILGGVAEVIKYGCIADARFFRYLERSLERLIDLEPSVAAKVVKTCCRIKADVVAEDEREAGRRAILNFGHTVGHAIEAVTGYVKYRHGIAVAIGMRAACELGVIKGALKPSEKERIIGIIKRARLPISIPEDLKQKALINAMKSDKKVADGAIRFAMLNGIGQCEIRNDITRNDILETINRSYGK